MQHLSVRRAVPGDAADILRVTRAAFEQYRVALGLKTPPAALTETAEDVLRDIGRKRVYIGFVNRLLAIGCVRCETLAGGVGYVSRFAVSPKWQSSGMGRALLEAVQKDCEPPGVRALALHTATGMAGQVRFYAGQGFSLHSSTRDRGYERGLFVKELAPGEAYSLEEAMGK